VFTVTCQKNLGSVSIQDFLTSGELEQNITEKYGRNLNGEEPEHKSKMLNNSVLRFCKKKKPEISHPNINISL
jgi:hypothetical protein